MGIENPYNPEDLKSKEEILSMLREKGYDDPETKKAVLMWLDHRQNEVYLENTSRAAIVLNIERVELYIATGDMEGAWQIAQEVYMCARQENERDLVEEVLRFFPELE